MASSNKTPNKTLSQFDATDKPSWLGDYNGDMVKIDAAFGELIAEKNELTAQLNTQTARVNALSARVVALDNGPAI